MDKTLDLTLVNVNLLSRIQNICDGWPLIVSLFSIPNFRHNILSRFRVEKEWKRRTTENERNEKKSLAFYLFSGQKSEMIF